MPAHFEHTDLPFGSIRLARLLNGRNADNDVLSDLYSIGFLVMHSGKRPHQNPTHTPNFSASTMTE